MHQKVRPELPALIPNIAKLPVDERGYPVPFFVQWLTEDQKAALPGAPGAHPDFRVMDGKKWERCYKERLCWVCGQPRPHRATFVIGPMCAINRTSSECPCHYECAVWSVQACPFWVRPHMVRREDEMIRENMDNVAGQSIRRNPGVSLLWTSVNYRVWNAGNGYLFNVGDPKAVEWWREGRKATRAEILESIESGISKLREACNQEAPRDRIAAHNELTRRFDSVVMDLLPAV